MNCVFANRRGSNGMDLETFWGDMQIIRINGPGSQSPNYSFSPIYGYEIARVIGYAYIFSFSNVLNYFSVWIVKDGVIQKTPLLQIDPRYSGIGVNLTTGDVYYRNAGYHEATDEAGVKWRYTMALVTFPSFSHNSVVYRLTSPIYSSLASRNSDTVSDAVKVSDFNHKAIYVNFGTSLDIWIPDGQILKKVGGTTSNAAQLITNDGAPYLEIYYGYAFSFIAAD